VKCAYSNLWKQLSCSIREVSAREIEKKIQEKE